MYCGVEDYSIIHSRRMGYFKDAGWIKLVID